MAVRAMQWAVNCGAPELIKLASEGPAATLYNRRICALHFERPCFVNDLKKRIIKLAVPTIFEPKDNNTTRSSSPMSSSSNLAKSDANSNCKQTTQNAEQCNNGKSNLHYTLAEVIAETVGLDKNECSQEYFYDDDDLPQVPVSPNTSQLFADEIDLPEGDANEDTEELFNCDGLSIQYSTVDLPTSNSNDLVSVNEDTSKELLCRLCALVVPRTQMVDIFGKLSVSKEYLRKMNQLLPLSEQPVQNDVLPQWICNDCCQRLDYCDLAIHDFVAASVKLNRLFSTKLGKKHKALMKEKNEPTSRLISDGLQGYAPVIKEEHFWGEPFEEQLFNLFDYATNQEAPGPNTAHIQRVEDSKSADMHHNPTKNRKFTKLSSIDSTCLDKSLKFKCSQCKCRFINKLSLFNHELTKHTLNIIAHTNEATYDLNVVRKPLIIDMPAPLDSQDCFFLESDQLKNIQSAVGREAEEVDNQLQSILVSAPNSKLIKVEYGDRVNILTTSKGSGTNKSNIRSFTSGPRLKKRRAANEEQVFEGKIIQSSHINLPTASDNKTFLCQKCDVSFSSTESALTHRFKEHAEEEIFRSRPK